MTLPARLPLLALAALLAAAAPAPAPAPGAAPGAAAGPTTSGKANDAARIVAVVNGDVISREDVDNRRRLFALSTGLPTSPEVLDRLTPQITRQLIDERLRLQEVQRRHIVVSDQDIAKAIQEIETAQRHAGGHAAQAPLGRRRRLPHADRPDPRADRLDAGAAPAARRRSSRSPTPTSPSAAPAQGSRSASPSSVCPRSSSRWTNPAAADEAQRFADTVIQQLRAGAPFPVVAAQFSQSQTALQGGDIGWVQPDQLDPAVERVLGEMPVGAVSNPVQVPGGIYIVTLNAQARDRQRPGDHPQRPPGLPALHQPPRSAATPPRSSSSCWSRRRNSPTPRMTARPSRQRARRPAASGRLIRAKSGSRTCRRRCTRCSTSCRTGKASQPLIAEDGIMRDHGLLAHERNLGIPTRDELIDRILGERVELVSRQLMRDLQRRAMLDRAHLSGLPPLREVITRHALGARRSLGQHFLLDANLTGRIAGLAGELAGRHVVEVGPGPGGLTRALLASAAASVTVVEVDPRAVAAMQELAAATGRAAARGRGRRAGARSRGAGGGAAAGRGEPALQHRLAAAGRLAARRRRRGSG